MRHRVHRVLHFGLLAACTTATPAPATSELTCIDCTIALERVGEVSDRHDPGVINDRMPMFAHDSKGRSFVATRERDAVLVFDSAGTFIKRLGQFGEGPGEFRSIRRVLVGSDDSILVTDWGTARLIVYGPELNRAGTYPLDQQPEIVLRGGGYVASSDPSFTSTRPVAFVLLDASGEVVRTVASDTTIDGTAILLNRRVVAESGESGVWTAGRGEYRVDRWTLGTGKRDLSLTVPSEWAGEFGEPVGDLGERPSAGIVSLWEADGLLWVSFRVADRAWTARPDPRGERLVDADEYDSTYDWVIEVIDPARGTVVASRRFERALWGSASSLYLASYSVTATDDALVLDIWRPRLVPRGMR